MHCDDDDDIVKPMAKIRFELFRVEAWIDIPTYNDSNNIEMLDAWLDQLDTTLPYRDIAAKTKSCLCDSSWPAML